MLRPSQLGKTKRASTTHRTTLVHSQDPGNTAWVSTVYAAPHHCNLTAQWQTVPPTPTTATRMQVVSQCKCTMSSERSAAQHTHTRAHTPNTARMRVLACSRHKASHCDEVQLQRAPTQQATPCQHRTHASQHRQASLFFCCWTHRTAAKRSDRSSTADRSRGGLTTAATHPKADRQLA